MPCTDTRLCALVVHLLSYAEQSQSTIRSLLPNATVWKALWYVISRLSVLAFYHYIYFTIPLYVLNIFNKSKYLAVRRMQVVLAGFILVD